MSIYGTLFSGISGLYSQSKGLSVIGNNLSNLNTVGYKRSRVNFQDVLSQSIVGGATISQVGRGVRVQNVQQIFEDGAIVNTGRVSDLAISGRGFFMTKGNFNGTSGDFYTRAGQFSMNKEGYLTNPLGLKLQGYLFDGLGNQMSTIGDLNIGSSKSDPRNTSLVDLVANLNSEDDAKTMPPGQTAKEVITSDPSKMSNLSTSVTVYDSRGRAHDLEVHFSKLTDPNAVEDTAKGTIGRADPGKLTATPATSWNYYVTSKNDELAKGFAGQYQNIADGNTLLSKGTLDFDANGSLMGRFPQAGTTGFTVPVEFSEAIAQELTISFDGQGTVKGGPGDPNLPANTDPKATTKGITSYASSSALSYQSQDGRSVGSLQDISIDPDGTVKGFFSNGNKRELGQVAIADFKDVNSLKKLSGNMYGETAQSGRPA